LNHYRLEAFVAKKSFGRCHVGRKKCEVSAGVGNNYFFFLGGVIRGWSQSQSHTDKKRTDDWAIQTALEHLAPW
jgi:hypothetical protein